MQTLDGKGNTFIESNAREGAKIFITYNNKRVPLQFLSYAQSKGSITPEQPTGWIPIGAETEEGITTLVIKFSYNNPSFRPNDPYAYSDNYQALAFNSSNGEYIGVYGNGSSFYTAGNRPADMNDVYFWGDEVPGFLEKYQTVIDPDADNKVYRLFQASTWNSSVAINREVTGNLTDKVIQAKQVDKDNWKEPTGSIVTGTSGSDTIRGLAGWDNIDAGSGDDLVHGGNGRDIITGGLGSDELHGDFGWNTYKSEKDGYEDLIAIKSDNLLYNWWYDSSGNSPNGEKSDIIEGLDSFDKIKIIGANTSDLSFQENIKHKGVTGVGIYAKGVIEALYIGGDLSASQISSMTTGDDSETAMANKLWSYWNGNNAPSLVS